jgi:hypothetical protein
VFSTTHTANHLKEIVELIAPQGRLALIHNEPLELALLMRKCLSVDWESMFTRSMLQTADMAEQHALLDKVAVQSNEFPRARSRPAGPGSRTETSADAGRFAPRMQTDRQSGPVTIAAMLRPCPCALEVRRVDGAEVLGGSIPLPFKLPKRARQ